MREQLRSTLSGFIGVRPWVALVSLLAGVAITVPSFYLHDLVWALVGLVFLGGALIVLLVPLPHPR